MTGVRKFNAVALSARAVIIMLAQIFKESARTVAFVLRILIFRKMGSGFYQSLALDEFQSVVMASRNIDLSGCLTRYGWLARCPPKIRRDVPFPEFYFNQRNSNLTSMRR